MPVPETDVLVVRRVLRVPRARLSFTWISASTLRQPTVVTVELLERGVETELVLTHRRLPPDKVEAHRKGWTDIVTKLEEVLAG